MKFNINKLNKKKKLIEKNEGINIFTVDCTVQSTVKGIKRKKKKKKLKTSTFGLWTAYNTKR